MSEPVPETIPANPPRRPRVLVALGSNLGHPMQQVQEGIQRLREWAGPGLRASSLWVSAPVDCPPDSPPFVNAVVAFDAPEGATPEATLDRLQRLEREAGRRPKKQLNEPRPLDLDLIGFGQETRSTAVFQLPHPRARHRSFVLAPLVEIAPATQLPGWEADAAGLLATLADPGDIRRLDSPEPEGIPHSVGPG